MSYAFLPSKLERRIAQDYCRLVMLDFCPDLS